MPVITALFKTLQLYSVQEHARLLENLYIFEERFALVLCDKLPCVKAVVCERISDSVIIARSHKRIVLVEFFYLFLYRILVIVRDLRNVKFIAERTRHRNVSSRFKRSDPAYTVVRAVRNVSAEAGAGIAHRSAVLYLEPFYSVGIIACPYLRRVVEHTCVKA